MRAYRAPAINLKATTHCREQLSYLDTSARPSTSAFAAAGSLSGRAARARSACNRRGPSERAHSGCMHPAATWQQMRTLSRQHCAPCDLSQHHCYGSHSTSAPSARRRSHSAAIHPHLRCSRVRYRQPAGARDRHRPPAASARFVSQSAACAARTRSSLRPSAELKIPSPRSTSSGPSGFTSIRLLQMQQRQPHPRTPSYHRFP